MKLQGFTYYGSRKGNSNKTQQQREQHFELLNSTQIVISEALEKLGYPNEVYELLKEPIRMMTVKIPVRMDDGLLKYLQDIVRNIMMLLVQRKVEFASIRM